MTDEIDYEAVAKQLQSENEQLRMNFTKAYNQAAPSMLKAVEFVQDHYIFFIVVGLWLALLLSVFDHIRERNQNDEG